jgi:hypothetical protein
MLFDTKWLIDRYIWAFDSKYASGKATDIAGEIYDKWCYMLWGMTIEPLGFWHERQHIGRICNHARSGARRDRIDPHTKPGKFLCVTYRECSNRRLCCTIYAAT